MQLCSQKLFEKQLKTTTHDGTNIIYYDWVWRVFKERQLKVFFISLAGEKVGSDFDLKNCQEHLDDSGTANKDIRNTEEDDFNEEDYNFEEFLESEESSKPKYSITADMKVKEQTKNMDVLESQEIEKDSYSEMKVQEEPLKIVSKKSVDVSIASHAVIRNLNVSLFIISILFIHNY